MLFSTSDQSSFLILIISCAVREELADAVRARSLLPFLPKEPSDARHSSAEAEEQQPDQRAAVVTGLRRGRRFLCCLCGRSRRCCRIRRIGRI